MVQNGGSMVMVNVIVATLIIVSMLSLFELPWLTKKDRRITAFFRLSVLGLAGFLFFFSHDQVASSWVDSVGEHVVRLLRSLSAVVQRIGSRLLLGGI